MALPLTSFGSLYGGFVGDCAGGFGDTALRRFVVSSFSAVGFVGGAGSGGDHYLCELDDGVICGDFVIGDVFFGAFLCTGVRILCGLISVVGACDINGIIDPASLDRLNGVRNTEGGLTGGEGDLATGVLSLQGSSGGARISLVRFLLHLLVCTGWCTLIHLEGLPSVVRLTGEANGD